MLWLVDEDFPRAIREARERLGLTQQQLADQVGVSRETVGNWETGYSEPRSKRARLLQVLGLGADAAPATDVERRLLEALREASEGLDDEARLEMVAVAEAEIIARRRRILRERNDRAHGVDDLDA